MFREINISKQAGDGKSAPKRRWYQSDYFDLFLWYMKHDDKSDSSANREFVALQLCYDIRRNQRALGWKKETGFHHHKVSKDGDTLSDGGSSAAILVDGGAFDIDRVLKRFLDDSKPLPLVVRKFVLGKLVEFGKEQTPMNSETL